jgi:hypothetical protein
VKKVIARVPSLFFFMSSLFFYILSSIPTSAPLKGKTTHVVYGSGFLEKVKKSIWLFTKVFV